MEKRWVEMKGHSEGDRYRQFFCHHPEAVFCFDCEGNVLDMNSSGKELTGYSLRELKGMAITSLVDFADRNKAVRYFERTLEGRKQNYQIKLRHKTGKVKALRVVSLPLDDGPEVTGVCFIVRKVGDPKQEKETAQYLVDYDRSTELPNKSQLRKLLGGELESRRSGTLMAFHLENLKSVNETLGYQSGDLILKEVAKQIKKVAADAKVVARIGGNEFALLFSGMSDKGEAARTAQKVLNVLDKLFELDGPAFSLSGNIGIVQYPEDGREVEKLLKNANQAMRSAKEQRKNHFEFFSAEINEKMVRRLKLESGLRKAIQEKALKVVFQPRIDARSFKVVGMEALLRWHHPELGSISPGEFIPIAESTGLIVPIGEWVLKTACKQNKKWQEAGHVPMRISVNLSVLQLKQDDLVETVARILEETGLEGRWLELEITEEMLMGTEKETIRTFHKLRKMGIQMAIDDFGTGYSSLRYLKDFPVNRLKIDRSFIQGIEGNQKLRTIVETILSLAKGLNLNVTAEGVEEASQHAFLKERHCDEVQGFLFSPPLSDQDFQSFLLSNGHATGEVKCPV
ncbi:MAG TPA: EAL domain-containing protein [Bacillales bacterium]